MAWTKTALILSPLVASAAKMDCGAGVPLCGVVCLQSGLGNDVYKSAAAAVHGLWPEVGKYGDSKCIAPQNDADPTKIYSCYAADTGGTGALDFEKHEWGKHGKCAGVKDVDDFFGQICSISADPIAALEAARTAASNPTIDALATVMKAKNYPVFDVDEENAQISLSACAGNDGKWMIAAVSDFAAKCGGSSPGPAPAPPSPSPSPPPSPVPPSQGSCSAGKPGPACSSDDDCKGLSGCVRCAHSGKCTDIPLTQPALFLPILGPQLFTEPLLYNEPTVVV